MTLPVRSGDSRPVLARFGRWTLTSIPSGWQLQPGFGLRKAVPGNAAPNICLREDVLLAGRSLAPYVTTQQTLLRRALPAHSAAGPSAVPFSGVDEALLLLLKHPSEGDVPLILQAQTYVRSGLWIGIVTLTSTEAEMPAAKSEYRALLSTLKLASQPDHPS